MSIFNSIGSNYDLGFAIRSLFEKSSSDDREQLRKLLAEKYGGKVIFTYKGREALRIALRTINKKNDYTVGVCGFTCFAVYEAVIKEGYKIEYLDIEKDSLNFSAETLKKACKKNPNIKVVFVQNTLGSPCDIEEISKFCREKKIILLEDLAHSIGTKYKNENEAGTVGDFVMLSFSQDKVIDDVSGGALVIRNDKFPISNFQFPNIQVSQQGKDSVYPLLTFLIRKTYQFGLGKVIHSVLKKFDLLSKPMEYIGQENVNNLSNNVHSEINKQFQALEDNLEHRRGIARIYSNNIHKNVLSKNIIEAIDYSTNIRFPIFLENRGELIKYLKDFGILISDIWYDAPVAPKKYLNKSNYKIGECPNAEYTSERILNLPTHKNVSEQQAKIISDKINIWLKSQ